jgi:hypothetical protein
MDEEINAAVEWWVEQLRAPAKTDAGNSTLNSQLSLFVKSRYTPLDEQTLETFRTALHTSLTAAVASGETIVKTDYAPDDVLERAAKQAGIQAYRFPVKTIMSIEPGHVEVTCGYGAAWEVLYLVGG